MLPGALPLHCFLLLRSQLFHRASITTDHWQTQNGTISEPFPCIVLQKQEILSSAQHQNNKPADFPFSRNPSCLNSIAWDQLQVFWFFAPVVLNPQLISTTTEIRAVKQNISSHCWHLCPSNSSRHSWDILGLKINSALPASPQESWALGAWLGRRTT